MSRTDHARGNARPDIRTLDAKPVLDARTDITTQLHDHTPGLVWTRTHAINEPVIDYDALAPWEIELLGRTDSVYASQQDALNAVNGTATATPTNPKGRTMHTSPKFVEHTKTIQHVGLNAATLAQIMIERERNRAATRSDKDLRDAFRNKSGMVHAYVAPSA